MASPTRDHSSDEGEAAFLTTRWSMVLHAGDDSSALRDSALTDLCRAYWYPLYAFARRQGKTHEDGQDVTQAFFARLLERNSLEFARPEKGRFRSFLLTSFKHFMTDEWRKDRALMRGGSIEFVAVDAARGQERFEQEPESTLSAEELYDRGWAFAVIDQVNARLKAEYEDADKQELYEALRPLLTNRGSESYAELGSRLSMSEGGITMAIHRMRRRFGDLVREEVSHTVSEPRDVDDEIRWLMTLLANQTL